VNTRIDCPLCDWHMDAEPPDVGCHMFGLGVMQAVAYSQHQQEVERELNEHLSGHSLVEWVRKVAELIREVERLSGKEPR